MNELLERLARQSLMWPERPALSGGETSVTYRQLWSRVESVARSLTALGVQRVGIVGDNSPAWVVADLACARAGVVSVPVPPFFSAGQVRHLTASAGLDGHLQVETDSGERAGGLSEPLGGGLRYCRTAHQVDRSPLPLGTRKITFTSGSTGTPKGVCLSEAQQVQTVRALDRRLEGLELPRHLSVLPLATLLENVAGVYLSLFRGAHTTLVGMHQLGLGGSSGLDARRWLSELNRRCPTSLILVPELARTLIKGAEEGVLTHRDFRFLAVGGGRVARSLLRRAQAQGLPLYQGYGLSECGSVVALNAPSDNAAGAVGRPLKHVQVRVGADGDIRVAGNTFLGYLGQPPGEAVAEVDTGDLGRLDEDGFLWVSGRHKNLLITAFGRNVSPEWLETELIQTAGMAQALVFGEGDPQPSALVYAGFTESAAWTVHQAVESLNQTLPDYARFDRIYCLPAPFQHIDAEAVTINGRIRRDCVLGNLKVWLERAEPQSHQNGKTSLPGHR